MKSYILDNFFLLVYVALRYRDVLFGLQVKLSGVGVAAADTLDGADSESVLL